MSGINQCRGCGAWYALAQSGEYVSYRLLRRDSGREPGTRNADTWSDGETIIWECPFCGTAERRLR